MLLPPKKLKHFSHYMQDHKFGINSTTYNDTCVDIIKIFYEKERSFLGLTWTKSWSDTYKFNRIDRNSTWESSNSSKDLTNQLSKLENNQWHFVGSDVYDKIVSDYPELLL